MIWFDKLSDSQCVAHDFTLFEFSCRQNTNSKSLLPVKSCSYYTRVPMYHVMFFNRQTLRSPRISRERSDTTYALNYLYTRPLHSLYTVSLRSLIIIRISANHSGYTSATRHKLLYFDAYLCIILCILVTPTQRSTCAEESSRACSEICRGIRMRRRFFFLRKNPFSRCDHRICISRKRVILSGTARLSRFIVLRESVKMTVATCYFQTCVIFYKRILIHILFGSISKKHSSRHYTRACI